MSSAARQSLERDNPWPGLAPFDESDRRFFHGRNAEAAELLRLVRREPLTVLFGRSGLGKTSLLKAGLFPALRDEDLLPVYVRLDHADNAPPQREQVLRELYSACDAGRVQAAQPARQEALWSFFHRRDAEFWSPLNRPVTPVIVFDQFEEIFTIGQEIEAARPRSAEFIAELADLVENRPPPAVKQALERDPAAASLYEFRRATVKLVLSFREDFLAEMEELKTAMPSLMYNRLRLLPMDGAQAYAVVTQSGGALVDDDVARRILRLAWKNEPAPPVDTKEFPSIEIDPALLSVVCSELNHKRHQVRPPLSQITPALLAGADREILAGFYERSMAGLDARARAFVEDELITDRGYRDSHDWEDALALPGVTRDALDSLIARRLLRVDERQGHRRLELTHDVLTRVVMDSRDRRRIKEEKAALARRAEEERQALETQTRKQRHRVRAMALVALMCLALAGIAGWQWWEAVVAKRTAEKAEGEAVTAKKAAEQATAAAESALWEANTQKSEAQRQARLAEAKEKEASAARQMAEHEARVAYARELAATALPIVKASDQSELAVLLGMHAVAATYSVDKTATREAEDVLRRAVGGAVTQLPFPGHQREVRTIAFSPDGTELATCADDRTVRLWNAASGEELRRADVEGCEKLAFSPEGIRLADGSRPGSPMVVRDVLSNRPPLRIQRSHPRTTHISLSSDGRRLAGAEDVDGLTIWAVATQEVLMKTPVGRSSPIALSADGTRVAAVLEDGSVEVRDVESNSQLRPFPADGQVAIALSPDGRLLAIAGRNNELIIWNVDTGERSPPMAAGPADALAFSAPAGRYIASATKESRVTVWDTTSHTVVRSLEGHPPLAFSSDGARLATAVGKSSAIVWDVKSGNQLATLFGRTESGIQAVALSSHAKRVATASRDGKLRIWDPTLGKSLYTLTARAPVRLLALSPAGESAAAWSESEGLRAWQLSSEGNRLTLLGTERVLDMSDMAFTDRGARLLTGRTAGKGGLNLWDISSGRGVTAAYAPNEQSINRIFAVAFSSDEKRIAVSSVGKVTVRDVVSGRELLPIPGHWYDIVLSGPNGRWLAVSGQKETEVWDVDARRRLPHRLIPSVGDLGTAGRRLTRLAVSEDGGFVATVDRDRRTVTVWNSAKGVKETTLYRHAGDIRAIAFTQDGTRVAVVVDDWTVHYHPLKIPDLMALARTRVKRLMTPEECQKYLGRPQCPALAW
jgi:WD40 repeat protein